MYKPNIPTLAEIDAEYDQKLKAARQRAKERKPVDPKRLRGEGYHEYTSRTEVHLRPLGE